MGSFQSRLLLPGEEADDCPPEHDGVPLAMDIGPVQPVIAGFLRCEGQVLRVPASQLLFDNIGLMIESVMDRLTLV